MAYFEDVWILYAMSDAFGKLQDGINVSVLVYDPRTRCRCLGAFRANSTIRMFDPAWKSASVWREGRVYTSIPGARLKTETSRGTPTPPTPGTQWRITVGGRPTLQPWNAFIAVQVGCQLKMVLTIARSQLRH